MGRGYDGISISRAGSRWRVRVRDPHAQRYRSKYFDDRAEGERWAKALRPRLQVQLETAAVVHLQDVGLAYLENLQSAGRCAGHIQHVRLAIEGAIAAGVGDLNDRRCPDITQRWLGHLQSKRHTKNGHAASPRTKNHYLLALQAVGHFAVKRRYLLYNPFAACERYRELKRDRPVFTVPELRLLVSDAHRSDPWWLFVVMTVYTGMRSAEPRKALWNWIDWERGLIRVPAAATKAGRDRQIPIQPELRVILEENPGVGGSHILTREVASANSDKANEQFQRYMREVGVEYKGRSVHALRHSAASLLTATGLSPFLVMKYIGHSSASVAQHYSNGADQYVHDLIGWDRGIFKLRHEVAIKQFGNQTIS